VIFLGIIRPSIGLEQRYEPSLEESHRHALWPRPVTSPAFDLGAVAPARQDPVALVAHRGVHRGRDGSGWLPPERQTFDLFSRHIELKTVEAYLPG
jgi:hypothetical protein